MDKTETQEDRRSQSTTASAGRTDAGGEQAAALQTEPRVVPLRRPIRPPKPEAPEDDPGPQAA